jgi:serine/threonine-protein kinase
MEYIEGIELGLLIHRQGPLAPVRALRIAEQMCEALQAAHDAGVIHRDLKPENILLLGQGNSPRTPPSGQSSPGMEAREPSDFVKVLDFGIAKSAEIEENSRKGRRLTRPGVAMGTPEYMAPEQAAGHPADPRSDIYAVGSIMYEMLCGMPPYEGDNVMEVLHKKANEPPAALAELRPALTPAIVALVERAMARSPDDRPKSMADLAYEIHTVETSLVMTPPPVLQRPTAGTSSRDDAHGGYQAIFGEVSETRVVRHFPKRQRYYILAGLATILLAIFPVIRLVHSLRLPTLPPAAPAATIEPPPPPTNAAQPVVLDSGQQLDSQAPVPTPSAEAAPEAAAEEANEGAKHEPSTHGVRSAGSNAKQTGELLHQAQQFLHAQRYEEARVAFEKLLAGRPYRGAAAAGLAKIAFQEKDYKAAVERAKESARMGGGAEARILLGDAYFKLEKFDEAKKAYTEALKLDPNNRVAGQGLRLVEGR